MKKIFKLITCLSLVVFLFSCEVDNYVGPTETLQGTIYDASTGMPLQLEQGGTNTRIKIEEFSKSTNPTPQYLNVKQDGSYVNTKLFAGTYRLQVIEGPFIPLLITNSTTGAVIEDNRITSDIKGGVTNIDFHVEPFLRIEYTAEPILDTVNKANKLTVKFKITKGKSSTNFAIPTLRNIQLFLAETPYPGNNNYEATAVGNPITSFNGLSADALLGNEITMISNSLKPGRQYFLRIGARVNDTYQKCNYSPVKSINTP